MAYAVKANCECNDCTFMTASCDLFLRVESLDEEHYRVYIEDVDFNMGITLSTHSLDRLATELRRLVRQGKERA